MTDKTKNPIAKSEDGAKPVNKGLETIMYKKTITDQEKEIERLKRELAERSVESTTPTKTPPAVPVDAANQALLERVAFLEGSISTLAKQGVTPKTKGKEMVWDAVVTKADVQDKTVTFSARGVIYVTSSYTLDNVLHIAPFKPIKFVFAGSDRRMAGKEADIINYCVYSTNIIKEIEFLRNHPLFGLEFSENLNTIISADAKRLARLTSIVSRFRSLSMEVLIPMAQRAKIDVARLTREDIVMELASQAAAMEVKDEEMRYNDKLTKAAEGIENQANK